MTKHGSEPDKKDGKSQGGETEKKVNPLTMKGFADDVVLNIVEQHLEGLGVWEDPSEILKLGGVNRELKQDVLDDQYVQERVRYHINLFKKAQDVFGLMAFRRMFHSGELGYFLEGKHECYFVESFDEKMDFFDSVNLYLDFLKAPCDDIKVLGDFDKSFRQFFESQENNRREITESTLKLIHQKYVDLLKMRDDLLGYVATDDVDAFSEVIKQSPRIAFYMLFPHDDTQSWVNLLTAAEDNGAHKIEAYLKSIVDKQAFTTAPAVRFIKEMPSSEIRVDYFHRYFGKPELNDMFEKDEYSFLIDLYLTKEEQCKLIKKIGLANIFNNDSQAVLSEDSRGHMLELISENFDKFTREDWVDVNLENIFKLEYSMRVYRFVNQLLTHVDSIAPREIVEEALYASYSMNKIVGIASEIEDKTIRAALLTRRFVDPNAAFDGSAFRVGFADFPEDRMDEERTFDILFRSINQEDFINALVWPYNANVTICEEVLRTSKKPHLIYLVLDTIYKNYDEVSIRMDLHVLLIERIFYILNDEKMLSALVDDEVSRISNNISNQSSASEPEAIKGKVKQRLEQIRIFLYKDLIYEHRLFGPSTGSAHQIFNSLITGEEKQEEEHFYESESESGYDTASEYDSDSEFESGEDNKYVRCLQRLIDLPKRLEVPDDALMHLKGFETAWGNLLENVIDNAIQEGCINPNLIAQFRLLPEPYLSLTEEIFDSKTKYYKEMLAGKGLGRISRLRAGGPTFMARMAERNWANRLENASKMLGKFKKFIDAVRDNPVSLSSTDNVGIAHRKK